MELQFLHQASISKWRFNFKIGLQFQNGGYISKLSFDLGRAWISKRSFNFEMELRFQNGDSIWKWSFDFKIKVRFRFKNGTSISKWIFNFKIELRFGSGDQSSSIFFSCLDWLFLTNGFLCKLPLIIMVASWLDKKRMNKDKPLNEQKELPGLNLYTFCITLYLVFMNLVGFWMALT